MPKLRLAIPVAIVVLLNGCAGVVSLHPLVTETDKDAVFDPALVGSWQESKPDSQGSGPIYVVSRLGESGYSVSAKTEKGDSSVPMRLLKVGNRFLLDVRFSGDDPTLPVHLFFRVRVEKDTAWIAEMDTDWLIEQIKTKGQLRYEILDEKGQDRRLVLTASTAELRKYLLPYVSEAKSFADETEFHRVK